VLISEVNERVAVNGKYVVVDRYWMSTQVFLHSMSNGQCSFSDWVVSEHLKPDLTVYLDLSVVIFG
jgi:thymidylate kinase